MGWIFVGGVKVCLLITTWRRRDVGLDDADVLLARCFPLGIDVILLKTWVESVLLVTLCSLLKVCVGDKCVSDQILRCVC